MFASRTLRRLAAIHNDLTPATPLPALRFEVPEAAQILRMSRAQLYNRIGEGALHAQKDGARTYISLAELERYVATCRTTQIQRHTSADLGR